VAPVPSDADGHSFVDVMTLPSRKLLVLRNISLNIADRGACEAGLGVLHTRTRL